jgi:hypothetical protein
LMRQKQLLIQTMNVEMVDTSKHDC